jgi:hypothetical protein
LYRSNTLNGTYTRANDVDWPIAAGIDYRTPGTHFYKVTAVNGNGESALSSPVEVVIPSSGGKLNKVKMDNGVLDVAFHDPRYTEVSTDTKVAGNENGGNFTIEKMYVTSDDTDLYVALDFGAFPPFGYARSRFVVLVDNPLVAGSVPATGSGVALQRPAYETAIVPTTAGRNVNQYVFKQLIATSGSAGATPVFNSSPAGADTNARWPWTRCFDDWQYYPRDVPDGVSRAELHRTAFKVIKFKVPKSNIGITANGQSVHVFAAFSEGFDNDTTIFVRGFIPKAAAPNAVDNGESMTINMADALEYTFTSP